MDELKFEELKEIAQELEINLKCPICLLSLQKKVLTCVNGHCICMKCKGDQKICPTCRGGFSEMKCNSLVHQILDIIPHTCRYNNCSYLVRREDDHESYCRYRPTPCKYCEEEVPAEDLFNHIKAAHNDKIIFSEKSESIRVYNVDLTKATTVTSLFSCYGHFFWELIKINPTTRVLSSTFIPVFCGKPKYEILVKISFNSKDEEYEVSTKIKMDSKVNATEENCLLVPLSLVKKFYNKEKKEFSCEIRITQKTQQL